MKYGPLRWELNIIIDVLGGWSEETEISVQSLVGERLLTS